MVPHEREGFMEQRLMKKKLIIWQFFWFFGNISKTKTDCLGPFAEKGLKFMHINNNFIISNSVIVRLR